MPVEFKMKVVKIGNSLRVTIPKQIVDAINITPVDVVGISLTDNQFIVRKLG